MAYPLSPPPVTTTLRRRNHVPVAPRPPPPGRQPCEAGLQPQKTPVGLWLQGLAPIPASWRALLFRQAQSAKKSRLLVKTEVLHILLKVSILHETMTSLRHFTTYGHSPRKPTTLVQPRIPGGMLCICNTLCSHTSTPPNLPRLQGRQ